MTPTSEARLLPVCSYKDLDHAALHYYLKIIHLVIENKTSCFSGLFRQMTNVLLTHTKQKTDILNNDSVAVSYESGSSLL